MHRLTLEHPIEEVVRVKVELLVPSSNNKRKREEKLGDVYKGGRSHARMSDSNTHPQRDCSEAALHKNHHKLAQDTFPQRR